MDSYSLQTFSKRPGQSSNQNQSEDVKPTFQFKHGTQPQKKSANQGVSSFNVGLQRTHLGLTHSSKLSENTPQRGLDPGLHQPQFKLSSRHAGSHAPGSSAYPLHPPENVDWKPMAPALGTFSRFKEEPSEPEINSRAYPSSRASAVDYAQPIVKAKDKDSDPSLNALEGGVDPDDFFREMSVRYRQLKQEALQQRAYIADLEAQVAVKKDENSTLSHSIIQAETAHKQALDRQKDALERAAKNYSALRSSFDDFKLRSESSSAIISEARTAMESIVALRNSTQLGLRDLESRFDQDGRLIFSSETRGVVHELHSELSKSTFAVNPGHAAPTIVFAAQQVADLLREKLNAMGFDLVEARARISELEGLAAGDKNSVDAATLRLSQSVDQMMEISRYLREQKDDSVQAATKVYEMEQQLAHAQTGLEVAESTIMSMREEMTAREEVQEKDSSTLRTLRYTIEFQEQHMKGLEERAQKADEELVHALNQNHELQGRLDAAKEFEKNLVQQASRLLSERDATSDKLQSVEQQLADVQAHEKLLSTQIAKVLTERDAATEKLKSLDDLKGNIGLYRAKYNECQVSLKVLQERFDDQSVTSAATKESVGELQERLNVAERRASEVIVESKRDIGHLQEQKGLLQARLDLTDRDIKEKAEALLALQLELSRREGACQTLLDAEKQRTNEALCQVQSLKIKVESLLTELADRDHCVQEMDRRLAAAEAPFIEHAREVTALETRVAELEATEKQLILRAATITHRYKENELNADEKALVTTLMQKARAIHDREIVEKNNDIKRRDNIIKQHEARIAQLEDNLARRIYDEPQSAAPEHSDAQGNSMTVGATKSPGPFPETRTVAGDPRGIRAAADTVANHAVSNPGRSSGYSTFAKLCKEDTDDIADFEEEKPLAGKRAMLTDDAEDELSRPSRRAKHAKAPEVERMVEKAPAPTISKKKVTKRR
ncbi:hypothetical protein HYDPIDRAFT_39322 [Hydnomerulius pinastri MD-312]|nr:hypothetical protein HYDPIDRAFT_39322 [Hydnomerulius pinastri MD-312]